MITSYTVLLDRLKHYCDSQLTIKRFGGEFKSELNLFANANEEYPIIFVSPANQRVNLNTTIFELDIYCLDILLEDRSNYNVISDCKLILNDMYNYYLDEYDNDVDVIGEASITDLNNFAFDKAIGAVMRITFEVSNYTSCSIPFKDTPVYITSENCGTQIFQYLTCETVTGCTSLQQYIEEQINAHSGTTITSFAYEPSGNTLTIELSDNTTHSVSMAKMSGMTFTGRVIGTEMLLDNGTTKMYSGNFPEYGGQLGGFVIGDLSGDTFNVIGNTEGGIYLIARNTPTNEIYITAAASARIEAYNGTDGSSISLLPTDITANRAINYENDYSGSYTNRSLVDKEYVDNNSIQVTGFTFNNSNYQLELDQSNNNNYTVDLSILASDMTVTGGTYNPSTGTATFTNNSGGTFDVTGFLTGFTDIYTTGATYDANTGVATFTRNDGNTYTASGFYTGYTLTSQAIIDALGYTPLSAYTNTFVTGFTNNGSNVFTISDNNGQDYSTTLETLSGLTINGNLDVTTINEVNSIQFNTTATTTNGIGKLNWNDTDGTLNLGLKGGNVSLQIGQEQVVRVVNKTSPLVDLLEANYQAVVVAGATGQRLSVRLAQADSDLNSAATIGLVTETILKNQEGFITTNGRVNEINTTGSLQGETWNDGDVLYLSPTTAGAITNVKPMAPQHTIVVGYVEYKHAIHGKIFVKVDNGYELEELHNVKITSVIGGDQLVYNGSTSLWENSHPFWTVELMDATTVSFYNTSTFKINSITNVLNSPTITILDDGVTYTLGASIAAGSKITVIASTASVIKLNLEY